MYSYPTKSFLILTVVAASMLGIGSANAGDLSTLSTQTRVHPSLRMLPGGDSTPHGTEDTIQIAPSGNDAKDDHHIDLSVCDLATFDFEKCLG